jgi:tetratricopeptide (TPR) repeat protein
VKKHVVAAALGAAIFCAHVSRANALTLDEALSACLSNSASANLAVEGCSWLIDHPPIGDPSHMAPIYSLRSRNELRANDFTAAAKDATHALSLNPRSVSGFLYRGMALDAQGRPEEALADLEQSALLGSPEAAEQMAKVRAEIVEKKDQVGAAATADAENRNASLCARTPDEELAAFTSELDQIKARNPMPTSGARDIYQWNYAFSLEATRKLETHEQCLGPHYQANLSELKKVTESAKSGCEALAAQSGACPQQYP